MSVGRMWSLVLFVAAALAAPVWANADDASQGAAMGTGKKATGGLFEIRARRAGADTFRYALYVPKDYTPTRQWPLIVYLHGAGERGDDGVAPTKEGLGPSIKAHPERFPAIVLLPQCPRDRFWDAVLDDIEAVMQELEQEFSIDAKRLYLTGNSMGGYGTWLWGAMKTDTFAALLPLCGGGSDVVVRAKLGLRGKSPFGSYQDRVKQLAKLPIWAFHGADDDVVPPGQSRHTVKLVRKAGGNVRYTEYPGVGHNCWDKAYGDPEVIAWLLAQHK